MPSAHPGQPAFAIGRGCGGVIGVPSRAGEFGDVGRGADGERVQLADPDLGREVDPRDRDRELLRGLGGLTLPDREFGEARLDGLDELAVRRAFRLRGQRRESLGGFVEPSTNQRESTQPLLREDRVDAERRGGVGAAAGPFAVIPAAEQVLVVGLVRQQMRAEETHRAQALHGRDPFLRQGDRLGDPARQLEHEHLVRVRPPDVIDQADLFGDRQRDPQILETLVDFARDRAVLAACVDGMALEITGTDGPGKVQGLVGDHA